MNQAIVVIPRQPELSIGEIAAKDPDARLQILVEAREVQMELQGVPQTQFPLVGIARPHQHIQGSPMVLQQVGSDMAADVSGGPGQEYRHVAPFVPVLTVSPLLSTSDNWKLRDGRASRGRPSISG